MSPIQFISQWLECRRLAAGEPLNDAASRRQRGASATEYALIVSLVALALIAAFGDGGATLGGAFTEFLNNVKGAITDGTWPATSGD